MRLVLEGGRSVKRKGGEGFYRRDRTEMSRKNGYSGWLSPLKG